MHFSFWEYSCIQVCITVAFFKVSSQNWKQVCLVPFVLITKSPLLSQKI
jgi:hypothetical protein